MCIVEFFKIKNYKLVIRVAASSSNSIQPVLEWQWQLWASDPQYRDFCGREPVGENHKIMFWRSCGLRCQFLWTKCADHFSCAATQFLVINAASFSQPRSSSVTIITPSITSSVPLSSIPDLKLTCSTHTDHHPTHRTAHWTSTWLPSRTPYHSALCFRFSVIFF